LTKKKTNARITLDTPYSGFSSSIKDPDEGGGTPQNPFYNNYSSPSTKTIKIKSSGLRH
jgi:hypothetical protein